MDSNSLQAACAPLPPSSVSDAATAITPAAVLATSANEDASLVASIPSSLTSDRFANQAMANKTRDVAQMRLKELRKAYDDLFLHADIAELDNPEMHATVVKAITINLHTQQVYKQTYANASAWRPSQKPSKGEKRRALMDRFAELPEETDNDVLDLDTAQITYVLSTSTERMSLKLK